MAHKDPSSFDGSDFPPNSYNGGNTASCVDSGAIPTVTVTSAGVTTTYLDNGQVLNGGGVDSGRGRHRKQPVDGQHRHAHDQLARYRVPGRTSPFRGRTER